MLYSWTGVLLMEFWIICFAHIPFTAASQFFLNLTESVELFPKGIRLVENVPQTEALNFAGGIQERVSSDDSPLKIEQCATNLESA